MTIALRSLPANTAGRDYVVGDIHGAFDLLMTGLYQVNFNPKVDRLFCTGDIVDRGKYSRQALLFLRESWVYSVRGNHEQMILDLYAANQQPAPDELAFNVEHNGMGWWLDITPEEQKALLLEFADLPLVMEVQTSRGSVGILHAEVPIGMDWTTFVREVEGGNPFVLHSLLWGRERSKHNDTRGVPGIGRVFAGHTPQRGGIKQLGNVYVVDTGAVFGQQIAPPGRLSVANLLCKSGLLATPKPALQLVALHDTPTTGPFGNYAHE